MTDIRFHPTDDTLACYTTGDLDAASSIMLSAHLEMCSHCRTRVDTLENTQAQQLALTPSEPYPMSSITFSVLFSVIKKCLKRKPSILTKLPQRILKSTVRHFDYPVYCNDTKTK